MANYKPPYNDESRNSCLRMIAETGQLDKDKGISYLPPDFLEEVTNFQPTYLGKINQVEAKLSSREKEVREKNIAISDLRTYVTDFWEVLRRRNNRLKLPAEIFTFYGLNLDGNNPTITNETGWIEAAQGIVDGEVAVKAAGYPAMINPGADEVNDKLQVAKTEAQEAYQADRDYDVIQEELAELRKEAEVLIADAMDYLRFALRKKDGPSQRRIMKTYGAKFEYLPGEPEDEEPAEPPAPTPET